MNEMTLRVPVTVKSKVTEALKKQIVEDLKQRLALIEQELQQIEFQSKRLLSEQAKMDAQGLTALRAQIEQEKQQRIAFKAQIAAQMKDADALEIGSEIPVGQMDQTVVVKIGDDMEALSKMEILLEDGKIVAFRK